MYNSYNISYDDVISCMCEASSRIEQFCNHKINYVTDSSTNNGSTEIDILHPVGSIGYTPMTLTIGTKNLKEHMLPSGKVRDEDAVWTMHQVFHETAHVWQYSVGYMQSDSTNKIKAMAKDRAIGICFPEYKKSAYGLDTSEVFADAYAMSQLKNFFDMKSETDVRFQNIDVDAITRQKEYQRKGRIFPELAACNTANEIGSLYAQKLNTLPYQKRFNTTNLTQTNSLSPNFTRLLDKGPIMKIANAANGLEESQLLCEYIGKHHPSCFRSLPCIKDEYCKGSLPGLGEQITGRILGVKPQPWRELPNVHINDHQNDDDYEFK